jgi:anti-anti-sigma factor
MDKQRRSSPGRRAGVAQEASMRAVPQPGSQVIHLVARVDATTVTELRRMLQSAIDHGDGDLVVDVGEVTVLDAAGLGMLVAAHRRAGRAGRRLVLRSVPSSVGRVLAMTRLHRVLNVERAAAMADA